MPSWKKVLNYLNVNVKGVNMNGLQEQKTFQRFVQVANLKLGTSMFKLYYIQIVILFAIGMGLFRSYFGM